MITYVLAKNDKNIDVEIINILNSINLKTISLMLKCYDRSGAMTP